MKRFTICLLILAVIFSLAACHLDGADVSAPSGTEASTAATTEATVSTTEVTDAPIMGKVYVYDKEIEYASTPIARKIIIYEDGAFYVLTYGLSNKMKQIEVNPIVALAGDWFTAHGKGVNLGYFGKNENEDIVSGGALLQFTSIYEESN